MPAPDLQTIYDFETALEAAFETVLEAQNLTTYVGKDSAEKKKDRPRVELLVSPGAPTGHVQIVNTKKRDDIFSAQVVIAVVTEAGAGETTHRAYRAKVREVLATLPEDLQGDDDTLPYHAILRLDSATTTPVHSPEEGFQVSNMIYSMEFAIRPSAWPT